MQIDIFAQTFNGMKNTAIILAFCCLMLTSIGCGHKEMEYKQKLRVKTGPDPKLAFVRYEDVLFNLDTTRFQEELVALQHDFHPFLDGDLTDPLAVKYLKDFATDPFSRNLFQKVKQVYPNLNQVEKRVNTVYRHFHYYYPEIRLPEKVYTCVSGINPESPAVQVMEDAVVISLDWYLDKDEVYDQIGMPQYLSERTSPAYLSKDLAEQLYLHYLQEGRKQSNLLEEMVSVGRMDYFIEALDPDLPDHVLLGYSPQQLEWAELNEGNLWADMVGNQLLYANGFETYRTFLADGPFTNEYSHEAPARLGEFMGLRIVRSYMSNHEVSLRDFMKNTDLQGLFQDSKYKPKK